MDLHRLPVGPNPPRVVNAIIEIPRGGSNKFEYDTVLGVFRLDRVLYSAVHYPAAYGFTPSTLADDGDAVDILLLTSEPTFTGALVEARPIGMLRMRDEAGEDEKVLAVPVVDPRFDQVTELEHASLTCSRRSSTSSASTRTSNTSTLRRSGGGRGWRRRR